MDREVDGGGGGGRERERENSFLTLLPIPSGEGWRRRDRGSWQKRPDNVKLLRRSDRQSCWSSNEERRKNFVDKGRNRGREKVCVRSMWVYSTLHVSHPRERVNRQWLSRLEQI